MGDVKGGVITLTYATPTEVPMILSQTDGWGDIYQQYFERMAWIRFSLRPSRPDEVRTGWLSDRDLGVAFVELVGIPPSTAIKMEADCCNSGFLANERKTIVHWSDGISLHDVDTGDSEMTPTTAVSMLDSRLVEVVCAALPELQGGNAALTWLRELWSLRRRPEYASYHCGPCGSTAADTFGQL